MIYGAGAFGKEIGAVLINNKFTPKYYLDINKKGAIHNITILHPEQLKDKEVLIIIAIVLHKYEREKILFYLKNLGFKNIIDGQLIRSLYIGLNGDFTYEYFKSKESEILKPLEFLVDEESKLTYTKNIIAHIKRNYEDTYETDEENQYFVKNIPFKKSNNFFIDCGAYNGDTFLELIKNNSNVKKYIGFEPIISSYNQLLFNIKNTNINAIALPLAVSDKTKFIKIKNMLGSSTMHTEGDIEAMCIKLDDLLHKICPTFVKMDIEGEEINALNGAKDLISNAKPELAISIYHYINHFWEIPNMLYNWDLGYDFYLRTHSSACMETILYAARKEL